MTDRKSTIPADLLAEVAELVSCRTGLHFPVNRMSDLERALHGALSDLGFKDLLAGMRWLVSSVPTKAQMDVLVTYLTVGETYFFRDKKCFDFLRERVFPELLERRREAGKYLRVWSAGCCTGEEPYSLAILLSTIIPDQTGWDVGIFGTDINPAFLEKASAAIYTNWSFRDTPAWVKSMFFTEIAANRYQLGPHISKRVAFMYHNLIDSASFAPPGSSVDLILCRNVLMYLTPAHQAAVVQKLHVHLAEGGWLIVSPSEVSDLLFGDFEKVNVPGAVFYRKSPGRRREKRFVPSDPIPARRLDASYPIREDHPRLSAPREFVRGTHAAQEPEKEDVKDERRDSYEEALLLYEKGLYSEAIERLMPLSQDGPRKGSAAALLSRLLADQGRLSEAIAFCEEAIASERVEAGHYYLRALIRKEQGQPREAAADLRRALYLDRAFVPAHFLLGALAVVEGKKDESARHFKNALDLLRDRPRDEVVPWTEGISAGRLVEIIKSTGLEDVA